MTDVLSRFLKAYVEDAGCWRWTRRLHSRDGYGMLWQSGRLVRAHRWSYEHFIGPIPYGLQLDHVCRNRACVNPAHLEIVTNRENVLRGENPTAIAHREGRCLRGHELTSENRRVTAKGIRCRTCQRQNDRDRYRRRVTGGLLSRREGTECEIPATEPFQTKSAT